MLKHFALLSALAFGFATSACDGSGGQGGTGGGGTGGGGSGGGGSGGVGGTGGGGTGGVGGVGGTGGGGTGGVGGGGAPGCDTAIDVMVPSTVTGTTAGAANLFTGGPTCPFDLGNGGDVLYAVTVPAGKSHLFFKLTPSAGSDPAMYVRTACADESSELDCHDAAAAGGVESLGVGNLQPGQTVYLVVDAYSGAFEGDYTLEVSSPDVEVDCNDLIDNDFDGFPDCQDDNCAMSPDCQGGNVAYGGPCAMQSECQSQNNDPVCLDEAFFGFPNGYCGELCDVLTNDCAGDGLCLDVGLGLGAGTCFDGCVTDGDCLGYHTCIDPTQVDPAQPAGDSICYPFEKACGDGQDNDLDGYPDCQDYDCFQNPVCAADLCATATAATLGDNAGNNLGSTNALAGTCGGDSTFEQLFVYTPPSNQNVTFTVTAATDLLVYVFTDCANASGTQVSGASGCVDGQFGGTPEVLGPLPLVGGTPYYIAVDSYSGTSSGPFTLNLTAN